MGNRTSSLVSTLYRRRRYLLQQHGLGVGRNPQVFFLFLLFLLLLLHLGVGGAGRLLPVAAAAAVTAGYSNDEKDAEGQGNDDPQTYALVHTLLVLGLHQVPEPSEEVTDFVHGRAA